MNPSGSFDLGWSETHLLIGLNRGEPGQNLANHFIGRNVVLELVPRPVFELNSRPDELEMVNVCGNQAARVTEAKYPAAMAWSVTASTSVFRLSRRYRRENPGFQRLWEFVRSNPNKRGEQTRHHRLRPWV